MSSLSTALSTVSIDSPTASISSTGSSTSTILTSTSSADPTTSTFLTLMSSTSISIFTTFTSTSTSSTSTMSTPTTTTADNPSVTGVVNPGNNKYSYYGCYNETTALNQTSGRRALYGGSMEGQDTMTVSTCLSYCNIDGFTYAGLEYETECWCAQYLSVFAAKLADSECNFACKGNTSEICGGRLKLSLYQKISNPTASRAPRSTNISTKLFLVGLAVAGLLLEAL